MYYNSRLELIRMTEKLEKRYQAGDKDVIKTEYGYKVVDDEGNEIYKIEWKTRS